MNIECLNISARVLGGYAGQRQGRKDAGFALIVCLLILVVLTLVAVAGLRSSVVEEMVSGNQKMAATALFGAEQGVSYVLREMFAGNLSDDGYEDDIDWERTGNVSVPASDGYTSAYTVRHLVRNGTQVEDEDGRRYFVINTTGQTTTGGAQRALEVAVAVEWGANSGVAGLIGCEGVTGLSNLQTSSYSSSGQPSDGDRGDIATTDADAFMYIDTNPDIWGQIRSTGAIYMDGNPIVRRDALANLRITVVTGDIYGSAYTNDNFYQCTRCVHGDIYQGPTVTPNPIVPYPQCDPLDINAIFADAAIIKSVNHNAEIGHTSGGTYSGSPLTLGVFGAPRDYYFSDFTLDDNKTLTVNGDVRIYVYNDFTMKNNPRLVLGPNSSLKVYVETGNAWFHSTSKVNHDPSNFFPGCIHPNDDNMNNDPTGGCPINVWLYSKRANTPKDIKVTPSYDEPNVWDDSQDVAGVKLDSNTIFVGIIYAPLSHVVLGSNVEIHGSARGRFVTGVSNFKFYYDEDLDKLWAGGPTDYKLVYWTEQYPE